VGAPHDDDRRRGRQGRGRVRAHGGRGLARVRVFVLVLALVPGLALVLVLVLAIRRVVPITTQEHRMSHLIMPIPVTPFESDYEPHDVADLFLVDPTSFDHAIDSILPDDAFVA